MIKNTLSVVAVASALFMASCSSEPSDLRPDVKVSNDTVPPGMRNNTSNIDNGREAGGVTQDEIYLNHDEHANEIKKGVEGVPESKQTEKAKRVENH